jgi:hypothetical protein
MRATASDVSNVKPIDAVSWKRTMSIASTPGGAVGCTSTGSAFRVDRAPDRRERGIGERTAVDVGEHHHAGAPAAIARSSSGSARSGTATGARRTSAAVRVRGARRRHVVVHDARGLEADVGPPQ